MSKLLKPFKIIRTHWKKSIFFTGLALYGLNWANEVRKEDLIRQSYCERAKVYGDRLVASAFQKPDTILVLVNRSARDARAKSQFLKNCAPILNLSGLDVDSQDWDVDLEKSTETLEGFFNKAKQPYSAVLLVGGNRTVNAYLNYAMNKENLPPAAFIPVGKDSMVMSRFLPFTGSTAYCKRLCEIAFKVVEGKTETVDVLRIENKEPANDRPPSYLYALSSFSFDKVTDITHKGYKYWYLPYGMKRVFAGLIGLVKGSFNERMFGEIEAIEHPMIVETKKPVQSSGWFWSKKATPEKVAPPPEPTVVRSDLNFDAEALTVSANHPDQPGSFLVEVSTQHPGALMAFLAAVRKQHPTMEDTFRATDVTLTLKLIPRESRFYIDGVPHSDFDRVVKISILPKSFKMFY